MSLVLRTFLTRHPRTGFTLIVLSLALIGCTAAITTAPPIVTTTPTPHEGQR